MTKKILSTVAAAAVLATGAMAYEKADLKTEYFSVQPNYEVNGTVSEANLSKSSYKDADAMIFPAFFAGSGFETHIRVVNTSNKYATVAKIVFFEKDTSKEIKDFNIYLSANDVWTGKVVEEGGKYYIVSTDDSAPLAKVDNSMASESDPLKEEIPVNAGYFEVLKSVIVDKDYHQRHKDLRVAYKNWAVKVRTNNPSATGAALVGDGVFTGVTLPSIDIKKTTLNFDDKYDGKAGWDGITNDANITDKPTALYGEVKLVNTTNKTAMVINPTYLKVESNATSADSVGLVYLEGEKANALDFVLERNASTGTISYLDTTDVSAKMSRTGLDDVNDVLITFDDEAAMTNGNIVLMTAPYKRILVQREGFDKDVTSGSVTVDANGDLLNNTGNKLYTGITTDATKAITNYGEYKAFANIYNNSETKFNTITFSPALPSYLVFTKEVQSTESIATKLSTYVSQAIASDTTFSKGGYVVIDFESAGYDVYAIPTWMQGTYVNGQAVTNWLKPATNIEDHQ